VAADSDRLLLLAWLERQQVAAAKRMVMRVRLTTARPIRVCDWRVGWGSAGRPRL